MRWNFASEFGISHLGLIGLIAGCCGCAPLGGSGVPARPFEPHSLSLDRDFQPGKATEIPRFDSRYSSPGADDLILEPPPLPPPPTDTTGSGLAPGCAPPHYLLDRASSDDLVGTDNRFSWWSKIPPRSGPLRPPPVADPSSARNSLICHFHPALARVVGQAGSRLSQAGFKLVTWDGTAVSSPNQLPGMEFVVRQLRPASTPVVRDLPAGGGGNERVLVNDGSIPPDISGDRFRPSVWFDFAAPQRAVAVEFGIPTDASQRPDQAGAKLIGYDRNGRILRIETPDGTGATLVGDGRAYGSDTRLTPGDFGNVVGIQDREGRIWTVELRFDYVNADEIDEGRDPGDKLTVPQVVRRIWHEPLPPAAVFQGSVGVSTYVPPGEQPGNVIVPSSFEARFGKPPGPETVALPFGLDRAVVMIRGVRWQFANPFPRAISEFSVGLAPTGVVELAPGARELTITPSGRLVAAPGSAETYHAIIDYTVLAWHSTQVELFATTASAPSGASENNSAVARATVGDPCPFSSTQLSVERRREVCGPLFGAPQGFALRMDPPQEIDRMDFAIGSERGFASHQGLALRRDSTGNQAVVIWEQGLLLEGDDDDSQRLEFSGVVLSGTGLRVGPDALGEPVLDAVRNAASPGAIPRADTGPRDDRTSYGFGPDVYRAFGLAWPVTGDVAFLALEQIHTEPSGPIEQLDAEIKGDSYQGSVIDWKSGLGINTEPPITNGSRNRFVAATALFGAVDNVPPFSLGFATKQDVIFESGVQGLTQRAVDIPGFIENTTQDAVWIDDIRRGTQPADALFDLEFLLARHPMERDAALNFVRVSESQLRDRIPLALRPGERITVIGRYTPVASTFVPDMGSVEFRLRGGIVSSVRVFALGSAIEANPAGEWRPVALTFDISPSPGGTPSQTAMLVSTGSTPLVIRRLFVEDATRGFRFETLRQIEPEMVGFRVSCGDATTLCGGRTRLIAETNAGTLALPLEVRP